MLRLILDSHPRIGLETRFLEDMERIVGADWKRLSQYGFPREEWLRRIAGFFGDPGRLRPLSWQARWADKSPRYAMKLPFIMELFPDAQVVHVIRDGRDVAVSHRKRFGYWSCVKSAVKWPRYIAEARGPADGCHRASTTNCGTRSWCRPGGNAALAAGLPRRRVGPSCWSSTSRATTSPPDTTPRRGPPR